MSSYQKGIRGEHAEVPSEYASASTGDIRPTVDVPRDPTCDLLLWKNPIETGKVFGLSLLVLLILKKVNLITFFLRVLYTVIFTSGAIEFVSKALLGQGIVSKYGSKRCPNVVGYLRPRIEDLLKHLPAYQAKLRTLVFAYEPRQNLNAGIILYFLHKFFSWFSVWTIVFLGVISAFTLPLIYNTHKEEIDSLVDQGLRVAKAKSAELSQVVSEKSQPYLEKLDKKLGPVSKFIKTQYANANASRANVHTTSSAAPRASTAGLAARVPLESHNGYTSGHVPSATNAASRSHLGQHNLGDLDEEYNVRGGHGFSVHDVENAANRVSQETGHRFPHVPSSNPLSAHDFSVDQLQGELKHSKDNLAQGINFGQH